MAKINQKIKGFIKKTWFRVIRLTYNNLTETFFDSPITILSDVGSNISTRRIKIKSLFKKFHTQKTIILSSYLIPHFLLILFAHKCKKLKGNTTISFFKYL
jgi:hypothetical protein